MRYDRDGLIGSDHDFMDSCHFTNLEIISTGFNPKRALMFSRRGQGLRHPFEFPANNPLNCTRDQLAPLAAGLFKAKAQRTARKIFWRTLKRLCFAQNIERDKPGSFKLPWPHWYFKDSDPIAHTYLYRPKSSLGKVMFKWFDGPDPLFPHYIFAIAVAAWPQYKLLFRGMGMPFFVMEGLIYRFTKNDDMGAFIACGYNLGLLKLFKRLVPDYEKRCDSYFIPRGFAQLGKDIKDWLKQY